MGTHWRELKVWQKTHGLVIDIYKVTSNFPGTEIYGLVNQLKRAAYSVPVNIVEGQSRQTTREYLQFLYNETFEKCSILFKFKEGENFKRRNTLSISRLKI